MCVAAKLARDAVYQPACIIQIHINYLDNGRASTSDTWHTPASARSPTASSHLIILRFFGRRVVARLIYQLTLFCVLEIVWIFFLFFQKPPSWSGRRKGIFFYILVCNAADGCQISVHFLHESMRARMFLSRKPDGGIWSRKLFFFCCSCGGNWKSCSEKRITEHGRLHWFDFTAKHVMKLVVESSDLSFSTGLMRLPYPHTHAHTFIPHSLHFA